MYNQKYIIPGIIAFVVLMTTPFWINLFYAGYQKPELVYPKGEKACVEATDFMRAEHMQVLDTWRDKVVREGNRLYTNAEGKQFEMSLQNGCMKCHTDKEKFCDKCHESNSVSPYCWDCHLAPKGNI